MAIEIERKFLVSGDFKPYIEKSFRIQQAYLSSVPERSIRIRTKDDRAFITIKGTVSNSGISRYEWEKEIETSDAEDLLKLCEPGKIVKTRHIVSSGNHIFEIDEFHGENQGLVIAEIELSSEDETFIKPNWLGEEVTSYPKYYNSQLSKNPFAKW